MKNSELMKYKYLENYLSTTYLISKQLTFVGYKYTINVCHDRLISKEWSEKNVRMYCAFYFISKNGQDKIIQYVDNWLVLQSSFELDTGNSIIEKGATTFHGKYNKRVGGPYYDGPLGFYQFLDCIMHLLFLGLVGTTTTLIFDWIDMTQRNFLQCYEMTYVKNYTII